MTKEFKLIGLNTPWKAAGFNSIYATVEYGKEDWFHCAFDDEKYPYEKLKSIFDTFKNSDENLWKKSNVVLVEAAEFHSDGSPSKGVIKELILDKVLIK